jgi:hypothetical protein
MRQRQLAAFVVATGFALWGAQVRADDHPIATVVPGHIFMVPGLSIRNGDWVAAEPTFWFVRKLMGPGRPIVLVARAIVGIGGSGGGVGFAPTLEPPCRTTEACSETPFFWPPVSLEAHIERMYGPTHWRAATYLGPQLSASAYVLKASIGWMVNVKERSDNHVQVGIGFGF